MICQIEGVTHRGRAVAVETAIEPATIAAAVREREAPTERQSVRVIARNPHEAHRRLGCLHPDRSIQPKTALAAAARARGLTPPQEPALSRAREALAELDPAGMDATAERRSVAEARQETERLRERVAAARGRLEARRERDLPTREARETLQDAIRELSEVETGESAARQTLSDARDRVRAVRDDLERRFRLEDEIANLRREARAWLVDRVRDSYESALADLPGAPTDPTDPFAVDSLSAGLAAARVASFDAPVVLACDRFGSARAASSWLDAPVILLTS